MRYPFHMNPGISGFYRLAETLTGTASWHILKPGHRIKLFGHLLFFIENL